jgi:hypothetical protein
MFPFFREDVHTHVYNGALLVTFRNIRYITECVDGAVDLMRLVQVRHDVDIESADLRALMHGMSESQRIIPRMLAEPYEFVHVGNFAMYVRLHIADDTYRIWNLYKMNSYILKDVNRGVGYIDDACTKSCDMCLSDVLIPLGYLELVRALYNHGIILWVDWPTFKKLPADFKKAPEELLQQLTAVFEH